MLRLHFTEQDLTNVRIRSGPDPMWELLLSMHLVQGREASVVFGDWRRQTRERLGPRFAPLLQLAPPLGDSPDFLTPPHVTDVDHGIEAVTDSPRALLRDQLGPWLTGRRPAAWAVQLASGDAAARRALGAALRAFHQLGVAPLWAHIWAQVEHDRARRARTIADGGIERLLTTLNPLTRWRRPVLEMPYPVDQDVHLGGRGLLLVPSYFCWRLPITLCDPTLPPVLVYPIEHDPASVVRDAVARDAASRSLANLVGRTRAAVLQATLLGGTTTELARRVGVSAASASQHAAALREAGLIVTRRMDNAVYHTPTELGSALMEAAR